ncbi:MAG: amidohydrolase [Methylobacter sp.]|nr:MAG: amidohydrolase [Methylobacter sp.]
MNKLLYKCLPVVLLTLTSCVTTQHKPDADSILLHAARVFDGNTFKTNTSVLVENGKIARIGSRELFHPGAAKEIDLGDATLLPGFIELHAHLSYRHIPADIVLKHGITTVRDVGGPIHQPYGGDGSLRVLTSGPIITAPGGYPIPGHGESGIAIPVATVETAREAVRNLVENGAVVIKVALEPGGEAGAPWNSAHNHSHPSTLQDAGLHQRWPLLPEETLNAIVEEAHRLGRKVTAHIGESEGAALAINAHVDEWAHVPCAAIPESLLKKAVAQQVRIVTTIDTLSNCPGIARNVQTLAGLGADFLYGAEIAHPDIPWGIDAQELIAMMHTANMQPLEVLRSATSKSGRYLNISLLGSLQSSAPADLIAVKGDPTHALKTLEYPDLVMSGGKIILNNFE